MQTRETKQIRVYKLVLNNMTCNAEQGSIVAISTSHEKLVDWYHSQIAPKPWKDGQWRKTFAKGSPLEWYNPCHSLQLHDTYPFGHGVSDEWVRECVYLDILEKGRFTVIQETD